MFFAILTVMLHHFAKADVVGNKLAEVSCTLWQKVFHTDQCGRMQEAVSHLSWLQVCDVFILAALLVRLPLYIKCLSATKSACGGKSTCGYAGTKGQKLARFISGIIGAVGLYLVNTKHFPWAQISRTVNDNVSWFGVGLGVVTLLSQVYVHWSMGCTWSHFKSSQKDHKLVICGAYQYTRHPMYLNFILHPLVVLLISQNWFLTLAYTPWVACALLRVKREERMLVDLFGQAYLDYMLRVPALGPLQWLNKHCGLSHVEAQKVLLAREHLKEGDGATAKKDE